MGITMRFLAVAAATLVLCGAPSWAADPVGRYRVSGNNPGGNGNYSGAVTVEKTGDTYKVTWLIGTDKQFGTGIGDQNFLAVSYQSGNNTGLALYLESGGNWQGVWTYQNGTRLGNEVWTRD
jgi:hypothetical protein